MDSRGHRQSPATSLGFCVHSELFGGEPAASGKNGVNTQPRVVLRAEPRGWGRLPLQEHPHIHALNPKLDPLVPEPRPPPNPPARAAACGPASPLRPSTLKLQPPPKSLLTSSSSLSPRGEQPRCGAIGGLGLWTPFFQRGLLLPQMGPKTLELESHAEP